MIEFSYLCEHWVTYNKKTQVLTLDGEEKDITKCSRLLLRDIIYWLSVEE